MSHAVGYFMIISGISIFFLMCLKFLVQPFIPEEYFIHNYFPSTEIAVGIPICIGVIMSTGLGFYIIKEMLKSNV
ncbi:hypothetical protein X975_02040, partial [Stegodyphus mimosarum]